MRKNNTINDYISPREKEVIARLSYEKITVVTRTQLMTYFNFSETIVNKIIYRLNKKRILKRIKNGVYLYSPLESGPDGRNINDFLIPPILFPKGNYYIGYSSMYNYYGFTDQIFQSMYILNTTVQREKIIRNRVFKLIRVSSKRIYGTTTIQINNTNVIVSDRERTLVDLIYFPDPIGGLFNAIKILKECVQLKKINLSTFIQYVSCFPIISVRKRIGMILEECKMNNKKLEPLLKSVVNTSLITFFKSKSRKGKINKKWRIIKNDKF